MKIAVYPGSFDPITNGHLDIIDRAGAMFDRLIVAVAVNSAKTSLFTLEERLEMLRSVLAERANVEVDSFTGLLVDYARRVGARALVRGLRAVSDFDYEYAIFHMNTELNRDVDTVFLLAGKSYSFLSSTIIKEVARYGRPVTAYTPGLVSEALLKKFGHGDSP